MTQTADILVIGGGIAGVSAARQLTPEASVIVLEAEDQIGYHATGRSAAMFIRNYGNATLRTLSDQSFPEFNEPAGIAGGSLLSPRGEMVVATVGEEEAFENFLSHATGVDVITPKEAVSLFPILREERIARGAIERGASDIDVDRLFQGYARLVKSQGGHIVTKTQAQSITRSQGVWKINTTKGNYQAPVLVNAAGAWADEIARLAGVNPVGLTPLRRSVTLVKGPGGFDMSDWPMVVSAAEDWYAKPESGLLMVSPADEGPVDPHDAWADDFAIAEGLYRFEQATTLSVDQIESSWAGLRTFTKDRTPMVGFAPDADGFFWLAGQGGHGVQTAPALSGLTADLVLERTPQLDEPIVATLSPTRAALS